MYKMMKNDRENNNISVALCTYNGAKYIRKQLNSILNQTLVPNEIIIVDDSSKDETREILKEISLENPSIKLFFNESNLGSNLSFRKAISNANNELIALCDQDDIWLSNKLEVQVSKIKELNTSIEKPLVSFHDLKLMNDDEEIINESFWHLHKFNPRNFSYEDLFLFNIVTGCTCLINQRMKKELLKSDMRNIIMHDYLIALIAYGFGEVIFHEEQLMLYRSHNTSVTTKVKISIEDRIKSFLKRVNTREYLLPNILQIEVFINLYKDKLQENKYNQSRKFIQLKNKSVLDRMRYKWLKKL